MRITARWLHLPIHSGAPMRRLTLSVEGGPSHGYDVELATDGPGTFRPFLDFGEWLGRDLKVTIDGQPADLPYAAFSEEIEGADTLYAEPLRPQFHFTSRRGWLNDPNGLVFFGGQWHLFYQHNPVGLPWGNMHWGHAVSADLVHWEELPIALHPDAHGTCFSGSAVVDWHNTSGFGDGQRPPLVLIYTAAGEPFTQCLAWSLDGRTFTPYAGNPVLPNIFGGNRDPKVYWHAPTQRWVMALYVDVPNADDPAQVVQTIQFHGSPDLIEWTHLSTLEGFYECPDYFPLTVEGEPGVERWVVFGADGDYLVGAFDGVTFTPSQPLRKADWGKNRYAAQTYAEVPAGDGRRIHIAWMNGGQYPEMPFNQQMSFPGTLHLRRGGDGLCLCRWPVDEIRSLWGAEHVWHDEPLAPGDNPLAELRGELWDLEADIALGAASRIRLMVRGEAITYDVQADELTCLGAVAPLHANGALRLRVLVDRTSLEVFAQDGAVPMTSCWLPPAEDTSLALGVEGGVAHLNRLEARELKSAWNKI